MRNTLAWYWKSKNFVSQVLNMLRPSIHTGRTMDSKRNQLLPLETVISMLHPPPTLYPLLQQRRLPPPSISTLKTHLLVAAPEPEHQLLTTLMAPHPLVTVQVKLEKKPLST